MSPPPIAALLEVMDKELPLWMVAVESVTIGITGFYLARRRSLLSIPVYVLALLDASRIQELRDPYVGPAILKEAGLAYVVLSYLFAAIVLVLPLIGLLRSRKVVVHG